MKHLGPYLITESEQDSLTKFAPPIDIKRLKPSKKIVWFGDMDQIIDAELIKGLVTQSSEINFSQIYRDLSQDPNSKMPADINLKQLYNYLGYPNVSARVSRGRPLSASKRDEIQKIILVRYKGRIVFAHFSNYDDFIDPKWRKDFDLFFEMWTKDKTKRNVKFMQQYAADYKATHTGVGSSPWS